MAHSICPASRAWMLDNRLRGLLMRPFSLLSPYVSPGMTVLDLGCGPGFLTRPLVRLVGKDGLVIAADIQGDMLSILENTAQKEKWSTHIQLHLVQEKTLNFIENDIVDFAVAFHMLHEVPDLKSLFAEVFALLKPGAGFFICEPKGHVTEEEITNELREAKDAGFNICEDKRSMMDYRILIRKPNSPSSL